MPQGSILGPLLFLIFINDIVQCIENCNIRLFADDTCLFLEVNHRVLTADKVNQDLSNIEAWAERWLVNFSTKKSKVVTVSNKQDSNSNPPIVFKGSSIEEADSQTISWSHYSKRPKMEKSY